MNVETFECTETAAEPIEACEEALSIIDKLRLEGQTKLTSTPPGLPNTRIPYREMTKDERFVYKFLCPQSSPLSEYKASPIPLRVLQIASHASSLGFFEEIVVWDREEATVKDPVLVGRAADETNKWRKTEYILARWGEELETFPVLVKRCLAAKRKQWKGELAAISAKAKFFAALIDGTSDAYIMKQSSDSRFQLEQPSYDFGK